MSNEKILFVDDEQPILDAITRQLRKTFDIETARSGDEALIKLAGDQTIAVVVSDLRMPGMDGVKLFGRVRRHYPDIIRVMLSGNADLQTAFKAVNNGQIFRFLTKPCDLNALVTTLTLALRHYQLARSERELLNNTLKGSISMLSELLSLANSRAFSSGYRIKRLVSPIADSMGLKPLWHYEVAALLSQIGCVAVPHDILEKVCFGRELSAQEDRIYRDHPRIGAKLIGRIPRLEKAAEMVARQLDDYITGTEVSLKDTDVQLGAQILRAALDYDRLICQGVQKEKALEIIAECSGCYNPDIIVQLSSLAFSVKGNQVIVSLRFSELIPGMIAAEDIRAQNGSLIIARGQEITWPVLQGLENFINHIGIKEPICVWMNEPQV